MLVSMNGSGRAIRQKAVGGIVLSKLKFVHDEPPTGLIAAVGVGFNPVSGYKP